MNTRRNNYNSHFYVFLGIVSFGVILVAASSCDQSYMSLGVKDDYETNCSYCHGNEENAAPPSPLDEEDELAIGAHQAHLKDGKIAKAMPCEECHIVPEENDDPNHLPEGPDDQTAEVVFGTLSKTGDLKPVWVRDEAKCKNSYCHGASLEDGKHTEPIWTLVDQSQIACDSCHGNPPKESHNQDIEEKDCINCHPNTVDEKGEIKVADGFHINGKNDTLSECYGCHGTGGVNDAPPLALNGSSDTNDIGVGAHQVHLNDGKIAKAIVCEECHIVPKKTEDPDHLEDGPDDIAAEVVFGQLSTTDNLSPSWDREQEKCSNTYCHGGSLEGGIHVEPIWTLVDESQITCESCHGNPPTWPHPQEPFAEDCSVCHSNTVDENGEIKVAEGFHINGETDDTSECYSCHGTEGVNDAPPLALNGASETSEIGVGAHQAHMLAGNVALAVPCEECHVVPEENNDPNHLPDGPDDLIAEVVFGELATEEDLSPAWDREGERCTNTYCHGASLEGGVHKEPIWTLVDQTQISCESCHGNPPPLPHPPEPIASTCMNCHPDVVDKNGDILVDKGRHIDGVVDVQTDCYSCHGTVGANIAPPIALNGSSDTNYLGVGAHQSHLVAGTTASAVPCEECHIVPDEDEPFDPEDLDDYVAEVVFGETASTGGLNPVWDRIEAKCTNTYCHGASSEGGNQTEPIWTTVDGSQMACDACHGDPPPDPHPIRSDCFACHPDTVDGSGDIIISGGAHVNGTLEIEAACNECHGNSDDGSPPPALDGATATTEISVGAHQSHLIAGVYRLPIPCTECHIVPENVTDPEHIDSPYPAEVTFGSLATTESSTPVWNGELPTPGCAGTYCHGATLTGGTITEPIWIQVDGSQVSCTSCHGAPPPPPHLQESACEGCHPKTVISGQTIDIDGGFHIDGEITMF